VYFRGKPFNPRKCKGINVPLTPKNIKIKTAKEIVLSTTNPVIKENQNPIPAKMPNTAPNLST